MSSKLCCKTLVTESSIFTEPSIEPAAISFPVGLKDRQVSGPKCGI